MLKTMHEQVKKIDERINAMTEANEIMTIKLKHGEEFSRSFKAVMESSRIEREEQVMTLESYKEKIFEEIVDSKREVTRAIDEVKMDMTKIRFSLNTQHSVNKLTDMNFDMYQKKTITAVLEAKEL